MKIEIPFSPGDPIAIIEIEQKQHFITCRACGEEDYYIEDPNDRNIIYHAVKINGELYICPGCDGKGEFSKYASEHVVKTGRITELNVHVRETGYVEWQARVNCSKTLVPKHNIFASPELALEELDKRKLLLTNRP